MTTTKPRFSSFEAYLSYSDVQVDSARCELVDGELIELPPESEPNDFIARYLLFTIASSGVVPLRLIAIHTCEIQVPVLRSGDPQNRYPDLVVFREEHLALTQKRLTIKLDMSPPQLVVEVVSPGKTSRERDYQRKRAQYQQMGIPEYWIVDRNQQTITVLKLENGNYVEVGQFRGDDGIVSIEFPSLAIAPTEIFAAGQ